MYKCNYLHLISGTLFSQNLLFSSILYVKKNMMTETGRDKEITIDVAALKEDLKQKMAGKLSMPAICSIFRVPTILLRHSPTAYTPNQFSFGPFHHHNKTINRSQPIKHKYLSDLLSRIAPDQNPDKTLLRLIESVAGVWSEARDYYAGPIGMEPEEFVNLMVVDGVFIIELFRKRAYPNLRAIDDPVFSMSCLHQFLWHDLILLENQIPWFVLEMLFEMTSVLEIDEKELVEITMEYFSTIFSTTPPPIEPLLKSSDRSHKHILDLLRNSLVSPSHVTKKKQLGWAAMRSASTLEESGIKFKSLKSRSILDIRFNKKQGVLEIPTLFIQVKMQTFIFFSQETTETIFRNLISLEQCCPNYDAVITSYAVLLDNLIDTKEDMEILCKSRAIRRWLNVDDAAQFFNRLYIDTFVKETFYLQLTKDVNKYCRRRWHTYRRVLVRDYFNHPWALISVIAAFIALVLTVIQTVCSIVKD